MAIKFDKKVICNDDFVQVEIIDNLEKMNIGGIVIPQSSYSNERLAFAKLMNIGKIAKREYGIEEGQYCLVDRLSTYAWTQPYACTKYNNIICLTNSTRTTFKPLKNMVFVHPDTIGSNAKVGNIYIPSSYKDRLHTGTITDLNFDEEKTKDDIFHIGDNVMLVKGGDVITIDGTDLYIFKYDQLICKINN